MIWDLIAVFCALVVGLVIGYTFGLFHGGKEMLFRLCDHNDKRAGLWLSRVTWVRQRRARGVHMTIRDHT